VSGALLERQFLPRIPDPDDLRAVRHTVAAVIAAEVQLVLLD